MLKRQRSTNGRKPVLSLSSQHLFSSWHGMCAQLRESVGQLSISTTTRVDSFNISFVLAGWHLPKRRRTRMRTSGERSHSFPPPPLSLFVVGLENGHSRGPPCTQRQRWTITSSDRTRKRIRAQDASGFKFIRWFISFWFVECLVFRVIPCIFPA